VIRKSRSREEHPRWADFRKHFSIAPFYCEPGLRGAHEKGGAEGQVGYWRRNYLTPVPRVDSLDELNEAFARFEQAEEDRRIGMRIRTIGQDFAHEAPWLLPMPGEGFETGLAFSPRVDRYGMVAVQVCRYSVPVRFIGRPVHALLRFDEVVVFHGRTEIARHPRLTAKGAERVVLDHFLEVLLAKPGALAGSEALDQARREGTFTPAHEAFWAAAKHTLGETDGTKALVHVLLLHRHLQHRDVVAGIRAALAVGACTSEVVALEARKAAELEGRSPTVTPTTVGSRTSRSSRSPSHRLSARGGRRAACTAPWCPLPSAAGAPPPAGRTPCTGSRSRTGSRPARAGPHPPSAHGTPAHTPAATPGAAPADTRTRPARPPPPPRTSSPLRPAPAPQPHGDHAGRGSGP
jgi:Mu transposase-like protein